MGLIGLVLGGILGGWIGHPEHTVLYAVIGALIGVAVATIVIQEGGGDLVEDFLDFSFFSPDDHDGGFGGDD